jgi:hypothetical protein
MVDQRPNLRLPQVAELGRPDHRLIRNPATHPAGRTAGQKNERNNRHNGEEGKHPLLVLAEDAEWTCHDSDYLLADCSGLARYAAARQANSSRAKCLLSNNFRQKTTIHQF